MNSFYYYRDFVLGFNSDYARCHNRRISKKLLRFRK